MNSLLALLSRAPLAVFVVALLALGCSKPPESAPADEPAADVEASTGPTDAITVALAELSPEDRTMAEKQKFCPVGGVEALLGSMGKPYKMEVGDRTIFLCCEHCKEKVEAEPDKYLAIVDAQLEKADAKQ